MLGELTPPEVEKVLLNGVIGRIGCISAGRRYVIPSATPTTEGRIYGHSVDGMKLQRCARIHSFCFEVEDVQDLSNWRSVIAWGTAQELKGAAAGRGMQLLVERILHPVASVYQMQVSNSTVRFESQTGDLTSR